MKRRPIRANERWDAPAKQRRLGRDAHRRDKGGKSNKGLKVPKVGRGAACAPGVPEKEVEKARAKSKTARSTARNMLVMCSVERSGAFLDYDDEYASDF